MNNVKISGIFVFLVLVAGYTFADISTQSRYPIAKGDVLIFQRTYEVYYEKGKIEVYNGDTNEKERITRTVTEKKVIVNKIDNGLQYGFPLKVGLQWGCNREGERSKDDHSYCSYVQNQEDVVVPAGVFEGCFKVVNDGIPETTTEWYCPGIGVVKSEYIHHGALTNEIIVLKKIIWK